MANPWDSVGTGSTAVAPAALAAPVSSSGNPWDRVGGGSAPSGGGDNPFVAGFKKLTHTHLAEGVKNLTAAPFEALDAVLGAPQRAVAGAIAGTDEGQNPLGMATYAVFHPRDTKVEERAEQKFLGDAPDNGWLAGLRSFGFQTVTDPLTYLGGFGIIRRGGEKALEGAGRLLLSDKVPDEMRPFIDFWRGDPEWDKLVTPTGKAIIQRQLQSMSNQVAVKNKADAALLKAHEAELRQGVMPDAIRQRLLQEPFVNGTSEMRQRALDEGYRPTQDELLKPPTGDVEYNVRADYEHTGNVNAKFEDAPAFSEVRKSMPNAHFEEYQSGEGDRSPDTLFERTAKRLRNGNAVIGMRQSGKLLRERLFDAAGNKAGKNVRQAAGLMQKIAHEPFAAEIKGLSILTGLSDSLKDAMFVNALPHMGNITVLGYLHGGHEVVAKALKYLVHGIPEQTQKALIKYGMDSHYAADDGKNILTRLPGVSQLRSISGKMLGDYDNAMRAALWEKESKGVHDANDLYEAASRTVDALGNYETKSRAIKIARAVGGFFPAWRLGVVPKSMTRAIFLHPERVERLLRSETDIANQTQKHGYTVEFSKPEDSMASLLLDFGLMGTGQKPKYLLSQSTMGPLAALAQTTPTVDGKPEGALQSAVNWGLGMVPGGELAQTLLGDKLPEFMQNPYDAKEKANPYLRAALGFMGSYARNVPEGQ